MTSLWFSVEYCWCSVDMRTYSAARVRSAVGGGEGEVGGGDFDLSICCHSSERLGPREVMISSARVRNSLTRPLSTHVAKIWVKPRYTADR